MRQYACFYIPNIFILNMLIILRYYNCFKILLVINIKYTVKASYNNFIASCYYDCLENTFLEWSLRKYDITQLIIPDKNTAIHILNIKSWLLSVYLTRNITYFYILDTSSAFFINNLFSFYFINWSRFPNKSMSSKSFIIL